MHICYGSFVGSLWRKKKKQAQSSLFIILLFSYFDPSWTAHFCSFFFLLFFPECFSLLFALMLIFGVAPFVPSLLLFFSLSFSLSLQCSFSLLSSARFSPLAFTGGYSSLGWAETASLYNTDRLLCNQIPSVATSEESLPRFLHHIHTHMHACRHTCTEARTHAHAHTLHLCLPLLNVCVVFMYNDLCAHSRRQPGKRLGSHFHHFLFFPQRGSKVIVFRYTHVCSAAVCEQDLGSYIRQEIVDFSSSVLDQRPTISKAASLSQCLPNVCPCSSTENFDTVPKVPCASPSLHPPPPIVI